MKGIFAILFKAKSKRIVVVDDELGFYSACHSILNIYATSWALLKNSILNNVIKTHTQLSPFKSVYYPGS